MDANAFLDATRDRVFRLDRGRAAVVAMACAQRLASAQGDTDPELSAAIEAGWNRGIDESEREEMADRLEQRQDVDDDPVAAIVYSLRASLGSLQDAWWAVSRFLDAAFDRAASDSTIDHSLNDDAIQPVVRTELEWLRTTLSAADIATDGKDLARRLRLP